MNNISELNTFGQKNILTAAAGEERRVCVVPNEKQKARLPLAKH